MKRETSREKGTAHEKIKKQKIHRNKKSRKGRICVTNKRMKGKCMNSLKRETSREKGTADEKINKQKIHRNTNSKKGEFMSQTVMG